ncbi:hypothetical protein [Mamestra configurata nucleopolyhedrovirus A]|uniref:Uncharacterized protein n=1 Tax=Mamestra configurata nucleopolyhedrovirus TaxID=207830 RepID=Q71AK3_NPVMC|nr:hypothetical protein [Mamestra configurata nucleopolyhedrovirus A]
MLIVRAVGHVLFCSAKKVTSDSTPIYSGIFRIVDYYTSIVYTVVYGPYILHYRDFFCTAKKFIIVIA